MEDVTMVEDATMAEDADTSNTSRRKLDFGFRDENVDKEIESNINPREPIGERHSTISEEKIPKIDMEFEYEEVAFNFYKEYAKMCGFSIRRHYMHKDDKGRITDRIFCCSCEGQRKKDKRDVGVKKHRPETRTNCCASMTINCRYTGGYKVVNFVAKHHGHDLVSPSKTHMLRSHRSMTTLQASQAADIDSAGV